MHVECSQAQRIALSTAGRRSKALHAPAGEYVTEADFLLEDEDVYFRIEVIGPSGKKANTNAYFIEDFE